MLLTTATSLITSNRGPHDPSFARSTTSSSGSSVAHQRRLAPSPVPPRGVAGTVGGACPPLPPPSSGPTVGWPGCRAARACCSSPLPVDDHRRPDGVERVTGRADGHGVV